MAFVNTPAPDDQNPGAIPQTSTGSVTVGSSPTQNPSLAVSAPTPETQTSTAAQKTSAPGFTNLSQYLQQNAPQADKLAGQVGDYVTQQGDQAKAAIKQAGDVFNAQAASGTTALDQNLVNKVKSDTTSVAGNADEAAAFQKMVAANYSGPQSLADVGQDYVNAQDKITQAEQLANSLQSDSTRRNIFGESGISNDATLGKNILNNLLLGDRINNIRPQAEALNTLRPDLAAAEAAATQTAQQDAATSAATKAAIANQFTDKGAFVDTTKAGIQTRLNQVQQGEEQQRLMAAMPNIFAPGTNLSKLSPDQLRTLGTDQAGVDQLVAAQKGYESAARDASINKTLDQMRGNQYFAKIMPYGAKGADGNYRISSHNMNELTWAFTGQRDWNGLTGQVGREGDNVVLTPAQLYQAYTGGRSGSPAPAASTYTNPYDLNAAHLGAKVNTPYTGLVNSNEADTATENTRLQALSKLLGVDVTAPMASADNLSNTKSPYGFNVQDAIKQIQNAKKGLK